MTDLYISDGDYDQKELRKQERKRKAFLLLPKKIEGKTKWLTSAEWTERYHAHSEINARFNYWKPVKWN